MLEDKSKPFLINYIYNTIGSHPATSLDLKLLGDITCDISNYMIVGTHDAQYKRKFFPREYGNITASLDLCKKKIEYQKETRTRSSYFSAMCDGEYPVYTANSSRIYGEDINEAGDFYLNIKEKLVKLQYNMTEDGSQSFNIKGEIPDARSASFYIWRDYEDIRVSDVSYFLKLNHSRLVISSFRWRPDIKNEINSNIRGSLIDMYGNLTETIDYWKKYIRFEIVEEINDIWENARSYIQGYLDDVRSLDVLKEDVIIYENYFNESYYTNQFYIQDIVQISVKFLETMSKRSRNNTYPVILTEIFEIMGDSGKNMWKNIQNIQEKIKTSYENSQRYVLDLINCDPMERLKENLDDLFVKCDQMMDDAFSATVNFVDKVINKVGNIVVTQKNEFIAGIAPALIGTARYVSTAVYYSVNDFIGKLLILYKGFLIIRTMRQSGKSVSVPQRVL